MEKPKITAEELLSIIDSVTLRMIVLVNNGWRKEFLPDPATGEFRVEPECASRFVDHVDLWQGEDDFGNPYNQITIFLR